MSDAASSMLVDEIDLRPLRAVVWRRKMLIVLAGLGAAAAAMVGSLAAPKVYHASAVVGVVQGSAAAAGAIAKRPAILVAAIEKYHLGTAPYGWEAKDLDDMLQLRADTGSLSVSVETLDPKLSADVVNFITSQIVVISRKPDGVVPDVEPGELRDFVKIQQQQSAAALADAETAVEKFTQEAGIDSVRLELRMRWRLRGDLEAERTAMSLTTSEAAAPTGPHVIRKREVERRLEENSRELQTLQTELNTKMAQRWRLTAAADDARIAYQSVDQQVIRARFELASRDVVLRVLDWAAVPTRPVSKLVRNTIIGGAVGVLIAMTLALLMAYLQHAGMVSNRWG